MTTTRHTPRAGAHNDALTRATTRAAPGDSAQASADGSGGRAAGPTWKPPPRARGRGRRRGQATTVLAAGCVSLLCALIAATPDSSGAFTARVTNATNTVTTAARFNTTPTCAAAYQTSAPSIWYRLDETSGTTAADASTNGTRSGTYIGSPTLGATRACPRDTGFAATFNGTTSYVSYGTQTTIPVTYSAETWFRTTSTQGGLLVGWGDLGTGASTTVDRILYLTSDGRVAFGVNTQTKNAIVSTGTYRTGAWHHAMGTVGSNGMRLYVDGVEVATSTVTATTTYAGRLRVGYDALTGWPSAPTSNFFAGTLDDVAVYSKTLTATDAANHYAAATP